MRRLLAFFSFCFALGLAIADTPRLPDGSLFIGLKQKTWKTYVVSAGEVTPITTAVEPRTASYNPKDGLVAYIGADGHLHEAHVVDTNDRILLSSTEQRAFTQPAYSRDGTQLFLVEMKGGTSADTEIIVLEKGRDQPRQITRQPAAQFEPRADRSDYLLYSSVSCVVGCGRIIQEIWRKHLPSDETEQITLTNAISRQPVASPDGKWVYFSSNRAGHYHLWRTAGVNLPLEQLTQGEVTDISPAVDHQGQVYFVRYDATGTKLMRIEPDGSVGALALPAHVEDLRNLEITP